MTTESQIQTHFLDRFAETHGEPPEGFVAALWKRVGVVAIEQLEAASERIIRTKKAKTFPSFAECLEAIKASAEPHSPQPSASGRRGATPLPETWHENQALAFLTGSGFAKQAARDGWIGPLVNFVRQQRRLPIAEEVAELRAIQRDFETTLSDTMRSDAGAMVRLWRPMGEAMAARQAQWADLILGGQSRREAA